MVKGILLKYSYEDTVKIENKEENIQDVSYIFKTLKTLTYIERNRLIDCLKSTTFLMVKDFSGDIFFNSPENIYIGKEYTGKDDLEIYFEDYVNFLVPDYKDFLDLHQLKEIGCKDKIEVLFEKPDIKNHITILDERRNYKRGLDGFDPDCEIVELSNTLKNISIEKSKIIWNLLKNNYNKISGIVETSKRANYQDSEKNEELSIMGNILISFAWIPSKEGLFFKPSEITLDELHSDFNPESLESKKIAEKLKFKFDSESKIIEQLSPDKKKKFQLMEKLFSVMTEDAIEKFIKEKENINKKNSEQSHTNVLDKFKETLLKESVNNYNESEDLRVWKSVDPETVENAIENEREKIPEKIENSRVENLVKIVKQTKIINDEQAIDPRAFLIAQYDGCCQICNIKLILGENKPPYFEMYKIISNINSEFNVLCLCPNCNALMKYADKDLSDIYKEAEKVLKHETTTEEVIERLGDYYITEIILAGKTTYLYYSPLHMAKLAGLLSSVKVGL